MARSSGILLHISSLPNKYGIGTLGSDAFAFVDFLSESKQKLWQILPLGPTGFSNSPYQSFSSFAGSSLLISVDRLVDDALLHKKDLEVLSHFPDEQVDYDKITPVKNKLLQKAFVLFQEKINQFNFDYNIFLNEHSWWLDDYALFRTLKDKEEELIWNEWEDNCKNRNANALDNLRKQYKDEISFHRFVQFIFFKQWFELKKYANKKGVRFIGDLPLYVALDSADVWANQDIFLLDENGAPTHIGGVPPDYFSDLGQLWGCPVFNWNRIEERDFDWWAARIHFNLNMFDLIRIDHFRGLESFWAVEADKENAIEGEWLPAKGYELLNLLQSQVGTLPVIAEDLGIITPEVEKLRDDFDLPGMKVLQFAFGSDSTNEHLPHNYKTNFVVYTGTHDNDTTLGWANTADELEQKNLKKYYYSNTNKIPHKLIESAWASVAEMAIIPLQDLLELDSLARMNVPGTVENGNWTWRFRWEQLKKPQQKYLKEITEQYNR